MLGVEDLRRVYSEAVRRTSPDSEEGRKVRRRYALLGTYVLLCRGFADDTKGNSAAPSTRAFFSRFLADDGEGAGVSPPSVLTELALSLARRGDVRSLTLLCVRHPQEVGTDVSRMTWLRRLPLGTTVDVGSWEHLLPCHRRCHPPPEGGAAFGVWLSSAVETPDQGGAGLDERSRKQLQLFFVTASELADLPSSQPFYLDEEDEVAVKVVSNILMADPIEHSSEEEEEDSRLTRWYASFARRHSSAGGMHDAAARICSAGLDRLGGGENEGRRELIALRSAAFHLDRLLVRDANHRHGGEGEAPGEGPGESTPPEDMTVEVFQSLGADGAVRWMMGRCSSSSSAGGGAEGAVGRCWSRLLPMVDDGAEHRMLSWETDRAENGGKSNLRDETARALAALCLSRLLEASPSSSSAVSSSGSKRQVAPTECAVLARASRTSLPRGERILRDEKALMRFVLDVSRAALATMADGGASFVSAPDVAAAAPSGATLGALWEMYESLPVRAEPLLTDDVSYAALSAEADGLCGRLVALEVGRRWSSSPSSSNATTEASVVDFVARLAADRGVSSETGSDRDVDGAAETAARRTEHGRALTLAVFDEFARRASLPSIRSDPQRTRDLALDFASDLSDLNGLSFRSAPLPIASEAQGCLLPALLRRGLYPAARELLRAAPKWFDDKAYVRDAIMRFSSEVMDEGGDNGARLAAECQEAFAPMFPDLQSELDSTLRAVDAARFVREVLRCVGGDLTPSKIRSTPPLMVVELILEEDPTSIVSNLPRWGDDPSFAARANRAIGAYFAALDAPPSPDDDNARQPGGKDLPPPPGERVLQLGNILGMGDATGRFRVRRAMAEAGVRAGLFGAAAALCQLLVRDAIALLGDGGGDDGGGSVVPAADVAEAVLRSVTAVVSAESYQDVGVRLELAVSALGRFGSHVASQEGLDALGAIVENLSVLEGKAEADAATAVREANAKAAAEAAAAARDQVEGINGATDAGDAGEASLAASEAGEFLVFKAAGLVARQAKSMVGHHGPGHHLGHGAGIDTGSGSSLYDDLAVDLEDMNAAFEEILQHSSLDARELLSTLQKNLAFSVEAAASAKDGASSDSIADSVQSFAASQSVLKILSRQLLSFCVSESTKVRPLEPMSNRKSVDAPTAGRVSAVLHLGTALLLDIQDSETALSILDDLWGTLETEASTALEQLALAASPSSGVADEGIVRQLQGRGYNVNGARRAAVMTNNEGFRPALTWAVAHFQDPDFDHPIVFLKDATSSGSGFLDQNLLSMVRNTLLKARECVTTRGKPKDSSRKVKRGAKGKKTSPPPALKSVESVAQQTSTDPPKKTPSKEGKFAVENLTTPASELKEKHPIQSVTSKLRPPSVNAPIVPKALHSNGATLSKANGTTLQRQPPPPPPRPSTNKLGAVGRVKPPPPPQGRPSSSRSRSSPSDVAGVTTPVKGIRMAGKPSVSTSKRGASSSDIIGEAKSLGAEERRRLAMQGRRLLEEARRSKQGQPSPVAAPSSGNSVRSISSMGSASPEDRKRLAREGRLLLEKNRRTKMAGASAEGSVNRLGGGSEEKKDCLPAARSAPVRDQVSAARRYEKFRDDLRQREDKPRETQSASQVLGKLPASVSNRTSASHETGQASAAKVPKAFMTTPKKAGGLVSSIEIASANKEKEIDGARKGRVESASQSQIMVNNEVIVPKVKPSSQPKECTKNKAADTDAGSEGWDFDDLSLPTNDEAAEDAEEKNDANLTGVGTDTDAGDGWDFDDF
uniref:UBA domain-containing protein n=1 Tax=Odontella aurita TaxID=265563 RepID=A0A7S4I669_9STRA